MIISQDGDVWVSWWFIFSWVECLNTRKSIENVGVIVYPAEKGYPCSVLLRRLPRVTSVWPVHK